MNPNELRKKKAELLAKAKVLQGEIDAKDSDLTPEQVEKRAGRIDEMLQEAEELEQQAKDKEAAEEAARKRAERLQALEQDASEPKPRVSQPGQPGQHSVKVKAPEFLRDPMKGFASPREFFGKVIAVGQGQISADADERLKVLAAVGTDEHQTLSNPYGGFLVPEGMSPNLLTTGSDANPLAGQTTSLPMDAPKVKINARVDKNHSTSVSGGLTVSRKAETAAAAASRMELEQIELEANSLFGFSYATEELLRDSPRSVAALIGAGFNDEFASQQFEDMLRGTGVGEPLGILNSPAKVTIAKESGQTADTINGTNIMKMRARAWRYGRSYWLANHDTIPQITSAHIAGTGSDVFLFAPGNGTDKPDTLLGRPIYFTEYAETLGDEGDLILCDPSQYLTGLYQPLESAESIHVRFSNHERAFKFWMRDAGQPWWRAALTPRKGASTLSPIVTLAARA